MTSQMIKGLALGLTLYLAVNLVASAAAAAVARRWLGRPHGGRAVARDRALFALRILPAVASLGTLLALFLPSYLAHEPAGAREPVGGPILALAVAGGLLLVAGARRGYRAWRATRRLEAGWVGSAAPLTIPGSTLPAYQISHPFPVVTVLGFFRPRLYVASQVLPALTSEQLTAVLDHERAHVASHDNLRHWLLAACPDLLSLTPSGERLSAAWLAAAEEAADERSARGEPSASVTLAEALLGVARLVPPGGSALLPALALHNGEALTRRLQRLLGPPPPPSRRARASRWLLLAPALAAAPFYPLLLRIVHGLSERVLALLS